MKKIFSLRYILLVLICLGTRCGVFAQENPLPNGKYVFTAYGSSGAKNTGNNMQNIRVIIFGKQTADNKADGIEFFSWSSGSLKDGRRSDFLVDKHFYAFYNSESIPKQLHVRTDRKYHIYIIGTTTEDYHNYYTLDMTKGYLNCACDNLIQSVEATMYFQIYPSKIELISCLLDKTSNQKKEKNNYLTYDNDVVIYSTPGLLKSSYNWEYRIEENSDWSPMPNNIRYSSDKSYVIVKGSEFFSNEEDFEAALKSGKKISFRVNTPTEEKHGLDNFNAPNEITLMLTRSAPNIVSTTPVMETCYGSKDAKIYVKLDRALKDDEILKIGIDNVYKQDQLAEKEDDKTYVVDVNESGEYNITLAGSCGDDKVPMFTYGVGHTARVRIEPRQELKATVTQKNVDCYGGHNGFITIGAEGGTGVYKASLYDSNDVEIAKKEIKETERAVFDNLFPDKYNVRLFDSNGCSPTGTRVDGIFSSVTIEQPSDSVHIEMYKNAVPKAYNSSDGEISVKVYGGSPSPDGYNVTVSGSRGNKYSVIGQKQDDEYWIYSSLGLPEDNYTIEVKDMRYDELNEIDKVAPCGCTAKIMFFLDAPEPIKVNVEETHIVNCYGSNEGVLEAHVTGGVRCDYPKMPYVYHWYEMKKDGTLKEFEQERDSVLKDIPAGKYCIIATDSNKINSEPVEYVLSQPDSIDVSFQVSAPAVKSMLGAVKAIVKGGTPPYSYQWNREGETTNELKDIPVDSYMLTVSDKNGCFKKAMVSITAPDDIKIDTIAYRHPSCYGTDDGEIHLNISGGNPPYKCVWEDNKNVGLHRQGLKPGDYILKITDSKNVTVQLNYKMEQPEQMKLEVGSAFVLCKGQGRMITASSNVEDAEYQWKRNGKEIQSAFGSELFVTQDGVYEVICKKKDSDCSVSASVNVSVSDVDLPIDITMSTDVEVDEKIHGVNISTAKMDKFEWILPDGAEKVSQLYNEIVFIMHTPGTYTVRAVGYKGGCTTEVLQTLNVKGDGEAPLPTADGDPLLKQFIVSPNPTDKEFNVHIELSEKANIKLTLKSPTGAEVETINVSDVTSYDHGYELNGDVTDCVFTLELSTGDNKQKSIQRIRKTIIKNEEK